MLHLRSYQKQLMLFTAILSALLLTEYSEAKVHFTLQGSLSGNSMLLTDQKSVGGSGSIAFDIGSYVRLGYTYRQSSSLTEGYKIDKATSDLVYTKEETNSVANSIDLTFVLYYGQIFVPYVQIGVIEKHYVMTSVEGAGAPEVTVGPPSFLPTYGPNAGIGLGIRLNEAFSLKLSYSISQGYKINQERTQIKTVNDGYGSVGLTYSI